MDSDEPNEEDLIVDKAIYLQERLQDVENYNENVRNPELRAKEVYWETNKKNKMLEEKLA